MSALPDEMLRRIMEIGIQSGTLACADLCRLSIVCRSFRLLAADDSLWSHLLFSDFPSSRNDLNLNINDVSSSDADADADAKLKRLYKVRYESDRNRKRQQQICAVLKLEGKIAEHLGKIRRIELHILEEKDKLNKADAERKYLCQVRHASVALNVWQPEVIRARQEQMIRQCTVPVKSRIKILDMELNSCKHQIACLWKSLMIEKRRLCEAEEKLASLKYHPLQDVEASSLRSGERRITNKKLKLSTTLKL
ncbi:F-box protein SKIP24 [Primulina huaijiensis]|uniref:F-box protein SKIP24 n=1 Tax=Primulina huaijiensis TaxID=1492673 RepID=UPI003CC6EAD0